MLIGVVEVKGSYYILARFALCTNSRVFTFLRGGGNIDVMMNFRYNHIFVKFQFGGNSNPGYKGGTQNDAIVYKLHISLLGQFLKNGGRV